MKILTLNAHSWLEEHAMAKLEVLASRIVEMDYDLVALQEVNQRIDGRPVTGDGFFQAGVGGPVSLHQDNFALILAQRLKDLGAAYYWCWQPVHIGYGRYHEGLALFSKHPIEVQTHHVSRQQAFDDFQTRRLLSGKTVVEGRELLALCCHYSWWTGEETHGFAYEWQQTLRLLAGETQPVLLLGDFNNPAEQRGQGYDLVTATFQDAYVQAASRRGSHTVAKEIDGWAGNQQLLRMDFIFCNHQLKPQQVGTVFDGVTCDRVSDHFGVEASLRWAD